MKTTSKYRINVFAWVYMFSVALTVLTGAPASAQHRDLYFGIESTTGNRKYSVHSDLSNLKG